MDVHILASGSTGNAACFEFDGVNVLVDAGISAKRTKTRLDAVGVAVEDLSAIVLTHEHTDHISGLAMLAKKYNLPLYATPGTLAAITQRHQLPPKCCHELGKSLEFGKLRIEPFAISHDAREPVGFNFFHKELKASYATDIGYITNSVKQCLSNSDVLVLESNHDLAMLEGSSYPTMLKQRIRGTRGHLSNNDCGWALARLSKQQHTEVFLAHLSRENNRPDVALETVRGILKETGHCLDKDICLHLTYPDQTVSLKTKGGKT